MHYDDRLATVLRLRTVGAGVARAQFRQLIDLLGTRPSEARGDQIDAAYVRLNSLSEMIPPAERAAIIGEPGMRLRSPRLVAALAEAEPQVAVAAARKAQLSEEQWLDLVPALPVQARGIVRHRRDLGARVEDVLDRLGIRDRGLGGPVVENAPRPAAAPDMSVETPAPAKIEAMAETEVATRTATPAAEAPIPATAPPAAEEPAAAEGIGALVKRIEAYRRARQIAADGGNAAPDAPRLPLGEDHVIRAPRDLRAFDFACDGDGSIVWTDPGVAPMAVGQWLAGDWEQRCAAIDFAIRRRQPIVAAITVLEGAPAIAGKWQVDASPVFDEPAGRYAGYRGRLRRAVEAPGQAVGAAIGESEADRMRQLLHELRTPVNAIQGFAEIIQQQLFGPTPHEYRALAASIAGDSARILGGFDELERLAKLDAGAMELEAGTCDFGAVVRDVVTQLEPQTASRSSGFYFKADEADLPLAIAPIEAQRLVWRLLAALANAMAPGERLRLRLRRRDQRARLTVQLPASLAAKSDAELARATAGPVQALSAGMFGVGFTLRLAATEVRAAGGVLARKEDRLRLTLPLASVVKQDDPGLAKPDEMPEGQAAG
ncbi:MAG: HAMP domain-containing histidine kinase [Sphingomonadales bacterium]|nr:HAMP domain-containing histidine kinase [Sphingomonadales bacterium]